MSVRPIGNSTTLAPRLASAFIPLSLTVVALLLPVVPATGAPGLRHRNAPGTVFIENRGQIPTLSGAHADDVAYYVATSGQSTILRQHGVSWVLASERQGSRGDSAGAASSGGYPRSLPGVVYRVDVEFIGAQFAASPVGTARRQDSRNFYYASCPRGIEGVPTFDEVIYREIYPSVDLLWRHSDSSVYYEFLVRPGGRPQDIRWRYVGATSVLLRDGRPVISTPLGELVESPLTVIETLVSQSTRTDVVRQRVAATYTLSGDTVAVRCAPWDEQDTLLVDPGVTWSTYAGGSADDAAACLATDDRNNVIVGGFSRSLNFPVSAGALQPGLSGAADQVLMKFDSVGRLLWATYYGGTGDDHVYNITVSDQGSIWVLGGTYSANYPVTSDAFQGTPGGDYDATIVKFDQNGRRLYATFYGGGGYDYPNNGVIDRTGTLWVGGETASSDFPITADAIQNGKRQDYDGFLLELDTMGARVWASYFGGGGDDHVKGLCVDTGGRLTVMLTTTSADLPTSAASYQRTLRGAHDAFIAQFDRQHTLLWSTYVGGSDEEYAKSLAADSTGAIYAGGWTQSANFPVSTNAYQRTLKGGSDAFLVRFSRDGGVCWASYLGGTGADYGRAVAVGSAQHVVMMGSTESTDFPMVGGSIRASNAGGSDAFVAEFDTSGALRWSTYWGGSSDEFNGTGGALANEHGYGGLAIDKADRAVIAGDTRSPDLPVSPTAFQPQLQGTGLDMFIASLTPCGPLHPRLSPRGTILLCAGDSVILAAPPGFVHYTWNTGAPGRVLVARTTSIYYVTVTDSNWCTAVSDTVVLTVRPAPVIELLPSDNVVLCQGDSLVVQATAGFRDYRWSTGDTGRSLVVHGGGTYTVRVTDSGGCHATSRPLVVTQRNGPILHISPDGTIRLCQGDSVTLQVAGSVTAPIWNDSIRAFTRTVRDAGSYYASGKDAYGCSGLSNTVVVVVALRPQVTVDPADSVVICRGDSIALVASPGLSGYVWNNGATGRTLVVSQPGTYFVTAADSNGCRGTSRAVVVLTGSVPTVATDPSGLVTLCKGDTILATAQAGFSTYVWNDGSTSRTIVITRGGLYWVSVSNGRGCDGRSDTIRVVERSKPVIGTHPADSAVLCSGDTLALVADSGYTGYRWNTGARSRTLLVDSAGVYTVSASDSFGCAGVSAPVFVTLRANPAVSIVPADTAFLCPGDTMALRATAGFTTYRWSNGDTGEVIGVSVPGVYWVEVTDSNGCRGRSTSETVIGGGRPVSVHPADTAFLCAGDTITVTADPGFRKYAWNDGTSGPTIRITRPGLYVVTATDSNGCVSISAPVVVLSGGGLDDTLTVRILPASGQAGDTVRFSIDIRNRTGHVPTKLLRVRLHLRVDASLLVPVAPARSQSIQGGERSVIVDLVVGGDSLAIVTFVAAVGDTDSTHVRFDSLEVLGTSCPPVVDLVDGSFVLRGACRQGGARFFHDTPPLTLAQNVPNPAGATTTIAFTTIERGPTTLTVYDILARPVLQPLRGDLPPGPHTVVVDAGTLATGAYVYVLRTPTQQARRLMRVAR